MNNKMTLDRDEDEIKKIVEEGKYSLAQHHINDAELLMFLISQLEHLYNDHTIICTITGAPGSGKTIMVKKLIKKLTDISHPSDFTQTHSNNILHREERN